MVLTELLRSSNNYIMTLKILFCQVNIEIIRGDDFKQKLKKINIL